MDTTVAINGTQMQVVQIWSPDQKVTLNFEGHEFACSDGYGYPVLIATDLVVLVQRIRDRAARAVRITNAFRTPALNKAVGGASQSQHMVGTAADIVVPGMVPLEVARLARSLGATGIGLAAGYTHVDVRVLADPDAWVGWTYTSHGTVDMTSSVRKSIEEGARKWN